MEAEPVLTSRAAEILHSIVRSYIETGEPVGSRSISKVRRDHLSAASIRNTMADLADEGYLSQPHTSAGRVPTAKAFRHYVGTVAASRLPATEVERLRARFRSAESVEDRVELSSQFLSELTRNVGIAAAMPAASARPSARSGAAPAGQWSQERGPRFATQASAGAYWR